MRFEEAYRGWSDGWLTQAEAAMLLGQCEVRLPVAVLVATGGPRAVLAAKAATSKLPIAGFAALTRLRPHALLIGTDRATGRWHAGWQKRW